MALENVRLYAQLTARIDELQRVNHELERFTWVSFHDFQEPLRMIATHSALIERGKDLGPNVLRSLSHVKEGERRLRRLTSGLAEYVDIREARRAEGAVDMMAVVQQALDELAAEVAASDADVRVSSLPWPVASAHHLQRLLVHLIGNAIKFRRPGVAPVVLLSGSETERDWCFRVEDNGIGIDATHTDRVFGFFERLHPQDVYPGSGLGLTICRKIIETLGGTIGAEASVDHGSVFTFTIPRPVIGENIRESGAEASGRSPEIRVEIAAAAEAELDAHLARSPKSSESALHESHA